MKKISLGCLLLVALAACKSGGGSTATPIDPTIGFRAPGPDGVQRLGTGVQPYDLAPYSGDPAPRASFETPEYYASRVLSAINAAARYATGASGGGVLLGLIDSGVDAEHPELKGALRPDLSFNYADDSQVLTDDNGHGTHVAGIMLAARDDIGMHGVAPDADLAAFRVIGSLKSRSLDAAMQDSYLRLMQAGARAVNHSYSLSSAPGETLLASTTTRKQLLGMLPQFIDAARQADTQGMISVWAAGNTSGRDISAMAALPRWFPELEDTWFSVVALTRADRLAGFSAECGVTARWCIAAPGTEVYSTLPGGGYGQMQGTSMAAPVVTGSIGLLASGFPELTGIEIVQILKDTARDLGAPGVDAVFGNGALDLENAMAPQGKMVIQTASAIGDRTAPVGDSRISGAGAVVRALAAGLGGMQMSVTDRYDRSFLTPMSASVSTDDGGTRGWRAARVAAGTRLDGFDAVAGSGPQLGGDNGISLGMTDDKGGPRSVRLAYAPILDSGTLTLSGGILNEQDGFLGTRLSGAYAADTLTAFVGIDWGVDLGGGAGLGLSLSAGRADLDGNGILRDSDGVLATAFGVSWNRDLGASASVSIGVSSPLAIDSGRLQIDRPIGLAPAAAGQRSNEVLRQAEAVSLGGARRDYDLELGYRRDFGARPGEASLGLGAVVDLRDPMARHSVSATVSIALR